MVIQWQAGWPVHVQREDLNNFSPQLFLPSPMAWNSHHVYKNGVNYFIYIKKKHLSLFQWPKHSPFIYHTCDIQMMLFFFFPIVFISWRLINLQYCSGFCHTLTWISHGFTCVPHPEHPSLLPPHPSGSSQCTSPEHLSYAQMMLFLNTKLGIYAFIVVGSRLFNDRHESPCYQGDSLRTHHTP